MKRVLVVVADTTFGLTEPLPPEDGSQTDLIEAALKDTLGICQDLSFGPGWDPPELVLCYSGDRARYAPLLANYWLLVPQMGSSPAQRLDNILIVLAPDPDDEILFIGVRTPQLEPRALQHAFIGIAQRGACLGPTARGGVYAIGIRGRWPTGVLEQVRWHDPRAMGDLQRVFRRLKLGLAILEETDPLQTCEEATDAIREMPPCDRDNLPFLRNLAFALDPSIRNEG